MGRDNYIQYIGEYDGVYDESVIIPDVKLIVINHKYIGIAIKEELKSKYQNPKLISSYINSYFTDMRFRISFIQIRNPYTIEAEYSTNIENANKLNIDKPLGLTGKQVKIAIIGTGIDYLNDAFINENGESRITAIWDQTVEDTGKSKYKSIFGSVYSKEEIDIAIKAKREGKDPYEFVNTKDEYGIGTALAGIVAGNNPSQSIEGIAKDSKIIVVKLKEDIQFKKEIKNGKNIPAYNLFSIISALYFLEGAYFETRSPMVILLPIGTNGGDHRGNGLLQTYIEDFTSNIGLILVTGAGSLATSDLHVSGVTEKYNEKVRLLVGENQNNLSCNLWVDLPNLIELAITAPSGQNTGIIPPYNNSVKNYTFRIENTKCEILNYIPEKFSGGQYIRINFTNIVSGLWIIKLSPVNGEEAIYNMWMSQKEFIVDGTRFVQSDPYGTVMPPGDSDFVITVTGYNEIDKKLTPDSSLGFKNQGFSQIDFAANSMPTLTTGLNNSIVSISGTGLSAAIGASACILLLQWGIVQGNYPNMYTQSIKTFLKRAVNIGPGFNYPNPEIGYGVLDFYKIFLNIT